MAEWLGKGLQNLLQRFDSASHLKKVLYNMLWGTFCFFTPECKYGRGTTPDTKKGETFSFLLFE